MRYHLEASEKMGEKVKGRKQLTKGEWVAKLKEDGQEVPPGLLGEEPDLFEDLIVYWVAFHLLSSSRSSGMSIGAIPLPAYETYFRLMGIDSLEERLEYIHFIGVIDGEYLNYQGDKHEDKSNKSKSPPKPKGHKTPAVPPRR